MHSPFTSFVTTAENKVEVVHTTHTHTYRKWYTKFFSLLCCFFFYYVPSNFSWLIVEHSFFFARILCCFSLLHSRVYHAFSTQVEMRQIFFTLNELLGQKSWNWNVRKFWAGEKPTTTSIVVAAAAAVVVVSTTTHKHIKTMNQPADRTNIYLYSIVFSSCIAVQCTSFLFGCFNAYWHTFIHI